MLPFAVIDNEQRSIVLLGLDETGDLVGFDPIALDMWGMDPSDIISVVSSDPAAVFGGVTTAWASQVEYTERAVANRARRRLPRFAARGKGFPLLPDGVLSGFPVAETTLRRHRDRVPSVDAIRVSALFAVSTVRVRIEEAEMSYRCFGQLYESRGRTMPSAQELRGCFRGLQETKSRLFADVADYASTIHDAMAGGLQDRELRSALALETHLPSGLGLAKLSFTLALLGQDCICLDARLLNVIFPNEAKRNRFMGDISKNAKGLVTERALGIYEAVEDAFVDGNRYYDPSDEIGRARAQWMSWEAMGGKGATHEAWIQMLPRWESRDER